MLENERAKDGYADRYEVGNRIVCLGQLRHPVR